MEYENWRVRAGLLFDVSDAVSVKLRYSHSETDDPRSNILNTFVDPVIGSGAPVFVPPALVATDPDEYHSGSTRSLLTSNSDVFQLTIDADLGFANLVSYTQYRDQDVDSSLDLDKTGLAVFQLGLPVLNETFTQELLLTSNPGSALQWTAGLFYFFNSDEYQTFIDNGVAGGGPRIRIGGSESPTRSYAAFVDATYELTPNLFITGGLRYAHDNVTDAFYFVPFTGQQQFVPDLEDDTLSPRVVLRYKPSEDTSIYASFTRGYKAGILDVGGGTGNPVDPEMSMPTKPGSNIPEAV